MTNKEKRAALVAKIKSREASEPVHPERQRVPGQPVATASASSLRGSRLYEQVLGVNIGDDAEAQMLSKKLTTIDARD